MGLEIQMEVRGAVCWVYLGYLTYISPDRGLTSRVTSPVMSSYTKSHEPASRVEKVQGHGLEQDKHEEAGESLRHSSHELTSQGLYGIMQGYRGNIEQSNPCSMHEYMVRRRSTLGKKGIFIVGGRNGPMRRQN